ATSAMAAPILRPSLTVVPTSTPSRPAPRADRARSSHYLGIGSTMASGPRGTIGTMALTLVLGPANSAKAGEVLGSYAAAARRGALLVVPTVAGARLYAPTPGGAGGL